MNNIPLTDIEDIEVIDEEYVEVDISREIDAILKWYNSDDIENVAGKEYYRRIFEEIFIERKPVSELSRESTITYWSLRNAVKIIKKHLNRHKWFQHIDDENLAIIDFARKYGFILKEFYCMYVCNRKGECKHSKDLIDGQIEENAEDFKK